MSADSRLESLLLKYEELHDAGTPASPEDLCRDCPDLLPEFRRRLVALASIDARMPKAGPATINTKSVQRGRERFRIVRHHAQGGLGKVSLAQDLELPRDVALKEIRPDRDHDASRERFVTEAELTGALEHPGIVPVYSLGEFDDGRPFYAMRFIRGQSFAQAIREFHRGSPADQQEVATATFAGPSTRDSDAEPPNPAAAAPTDLSSRRRGYDSLEFRQLLGRFVAVCNAVDYAHSRGVLHRDIKPANVMLGDFGETLLVDWGLARKFKRTGEQEEARFSKAPAESEGAVLGTPAYMSPEQASGRLGELSAASDIYSLGASLYQLLTGDPPIVGRSDREVLAKAVAGDFAPPRRVASSVPKPLEAICLKAMHQEKSNRYPSATELGRDVERFLADEPVQAWREPLTVRWSRVVRRHRGAATSAGIGLMIVAIVSIGAAWREARLRESEIASRKAAEIAEDETLVAYRASTDDALEKLIGSRPELGTHERAYLENAGSRWQSFANREGNDERSLNIRAEGHYRLAVIWQFLGRTQSSATEFAAARDTMLTLLKESPQSREYRLRTATAHQGLGALQSDLDQTSEALESHRAALQLRESLLSEDPQSLQVREELAKTHLAIGTVHQKLGDMKAALGEYRLARNAVEPIVRRLPTRSESLHVLASSASRIGSATHALGDREEALKAFREGRDRYRELLQLAPTDPEFRHGLSTSYSNVGESLAGLGKHREALTEHEAAFQMQTSLCREYPAILTYRLDRAQTLYDLGGVLSDLRQHSEARTRLEEACTEFQKIVDESGAVPEHRQLLAEARNRLANVLSEIQLPQEAIASYEVSRELHRALADEFPRVPEYRRGLAATYANLGLLYLGRQSVAEAIAAYESALTLQARLVEEHRDNVIYRAQLAQIHNNLAMVFHRKGDYDRALAEYRAARDEQEKLVEQQPNHLNSLLALARSQHNLGLLLLSLGRFDDSRVDLDAALIQCAKAEECEPGHPEAAQIRAATLFNRAALRRALGDRAGQRTDLEAARNVQIQLVERYPDQIDATLGLGRTRVNLASLLSELGEDESAKVEYVAARDLLISQASKVKNIIPDIHLALAAAHNNLAVLLERFGDRQEAEREFSAGIEVQKSLADGFRHVDEFAFGLGNMYRNRGDFWQRQNEFARAIESYDAAIAIIEPLHGRKPSERTLALLRGGLAGRASTRDSLREFEPAELDWKRAIELSKPSERPSVSLQRILSKFQTGRLAEAVAECEPLLSGEQWSASDWYNFACIFATGAEKIPERKQEYADRAIELLRRAVESGFRDAEKIASDVDLVALRERDDFQDILAQLRQSAEDVSEPTVKSAE